VTLQPGAQPRSVEADAIVLAGGRGRRLGGIDKAEILVDGRSLLERLLTALATTPAVGRTVVVGAATVPTTMRATVHQVVEDPPGSGPVAAVAAGLGDLGGSGRTPARWTLVLAVDQPSAGTGARALVKAIQAHHVGSPALEALVPRDSDGRWQWLLAGYRTESLRGAILGLPRLQDAAMRRVFGALRVGDVDLDPSVLGDIDTPADLARWSPGSGAQWS